MLEILRKVSSSEDPETKAHGLIFIGPIFLFFSLSLAIHFKSYELCFVIFTGLLLLWRFRMQGLYLASGLLFLSAVWTHLFTFPSHFWHFGLEASIAAGFAITALSLEEIREVFQGFKKKIGEKEEEREKITLTLKEASDQHEDEKKSLFETFEHLKKELLDSQKEKTTLQELVESLRFAQDETKEWKESLLLEITQKTRRVGVLSYQMKEMEKELAAVQDLDTLQKENRDLQAKLNEVRVMHHQKELMTETVTNQLSKEAERVQTAKENIQIREREKEDLEKRLEDAKEEIKRLCTSLEKASGELEKTREKLLPENAPGFQALKEQIATLEKEKEALEKKNSAPMSEVVDLKNACQKLEKEIAQKEEMLENYQNKMQEWKSLEPIYYQLRKQFEEKSAVLHQTRSDLFHAEGEITALKMEKENQKMGWDPSIDRIAEEVASYEEEFSYLQKENEELMRLISFLSKKEEPDGELPLY